MARANIGKINEWKAANVSRINLEIRNDTGIMEALQSAVSAGFAKSRQSYILNAVRAALERDGIQLPNKEAPGE